MNNDNSSIFGVKKSERRIILAAFAYIFFVICAYYVIKPIRGSLGMELGKDNIPLLNLLSMIVLIVSNTVYSVIVGAYRRDIFIPFITRFFTLCLLIFWLLFAFVCPAVDDQASAKTVKTNLATLSKERIVNATTSVQLKSRLFKRNPVRAATIAVFYLWVGMFALMAVTMFWSFMNDVFTVAQSRRLYAIIGYGGLIGGAVGSFLTSKLVSLIGTNNLFLVACFLLYPTIWCMRYIHNKHVKQSTIKIPPLDLPTENKNALPVHPPRPWDGLLSVVKTPILIFMSCEMFIFTFSGTLFYQQLYEMLNQTFSSATDATTSFFADFYGKITLFSLFSQFFITKLFMMFPNPVVGLFIFPIMQLLASFLMLTSPSLSIVSWTLIIGSAINYSSGRAIRELVYIPLNREQKYQGKGFIDTVIFRLGDGLSALMLIGGLELFGYGIWIDWTIIVLMFVQTYVILKITRLYAKRLKGLKDC